MKQIIKNLLNTGYSRTTKGAEILNRYFMLRPAVTLLDNGNLKANRANAFWSQGNNANRIELACDVVLSHKWSATDRYCFHILNRFANGDAYGMSK